MIRIIHQGVKVMCYAMPCFAFLLYFAKREGEKIAITTYKKIAALPLLACLSIMPRESVVSSHHYFPYCLLCNEYVPPQ